MTKLTSLNLLMVFFAFNSTIPAFAQLDGVPPVNKPEAVDLKKVSQKYVSTQYEVELDVIQNRQFTKKNRFELTALGVSVSSDPFITTYSAGAILGYHFSEYFGARVLYWHDFSSKNAAWDAANGKGSYLNTVMPKSYMGAEFKFSPFYGKLSMLQKSILYYDFYALAGGGLRSLEYNQAITPVLGVGQQIFFNKHLSLTVEYRVMMYKQVVKEQLSSDPNFGNEIGTKTPFVGNVSVGISFLI
jgi:outer membrane beta-barrel protein